MIQKEYPSEVTIGTSSRDLLHRVYAWMAGGLALTALTAYYVSITPALYTFFFKNPPLLFMLFAVQLGFVIVLSMFLHRMSFITAALLFVLYAFSLGITLSAIFLVYTKASIFATFLVTSGMFGVMSLYGYFTQADLSSMGSYLLMGLIGLIVSLVVNLFLASPFFNFLISVAGVFVFTLLTAYDVQRIKRMGQQVGMNKETINKVALLGALALYLDFVNLFLYILQFTGNRKS